MEQTSKLSIVVNTQTAQKQLTEFRSNLRLVERSGQDMDKSLSKIGSKTQFAGLEASIKNLYKTMNNAGNSVNSFSKVIDNARALSDATRVITKSINDLNATKNKSSKSNGLGSSLADAEKKALTLSTSIEGLQKKFNSLNTTLGISRKELGSFGGAAIATKTNVALLGDALKVNSTNIGALNTKIISVSSSTKNLGSAAAAAKARANELANSYRLVNTGLQSNAQFLQQANKAMSANSKEAVTARLIQDRLAISSSKVATAASNAAAAATKEQIALANLAAASSKADAQLLGVAAAAAKVSAANSNAAGAATRATGETVKLAAANSRAATEASRAAAAVTAEAAALSRAASAASNAAGAQDRASVAAIRLAAAEARAAADADRLAGGLGRANTQSRGLMGSINSLQGALAGGLFAVTGLGVLKTADEMQNLNSQVKLVTNSTSEFLGVREKVREIADKNFNDISATTNLYQKSATALANLGKSQSEALIFTDAVSLAMRTGGRSAQEQASAILQLGQAMGSGVLMGDEFRSIAENAPILLELVAKRMGVLPGQLKELASEGKITSEIMYDAFSQNVDLLEDMAKKMPLTMSQSFVVAKNNYKKFVDDLMNDTGGASSKIASFISGISGNFDTLAKVAMAGIALGFVQITASIVTASNAMKVFNLITSSNPLIFVATAFLAVTSAIYGTNEVLTLSGQIMSDLMDELGETAKFLGNIWDDAATWIMENVFKIEQAVEESNDKNRKSYFGFYEETEKGFAGLVQRIMGNIASVGALTGSMITYYQTFVDNLITSVTNLTTAFSNLYKMGANLFGADKKLGDFENYKTMDILQIYRDENSKNQDVVAGYIRGANKDAGTAEPTYKNALRSSVFNGNVTFNSLTSAGSGVLMPAGKGLPSNIKAPNSQISNLPISEVKAAQYRQQQADDAITAAKEERAKAEKEREKEAKKQAKADKEAGKGLSNRLVGISGDTGVGNAHLHVQYRDKSRAVSAADLSRFQAGGKKITDYKMTSAFGKRNTGIKGASTNHKGTDFGIPKNTPITTNVAVKSVKTWNDSKGGGYVSTITFEDGVVIDLLHQMPSVMGVDKGSSTGNKSVDSLVSKAENEVLKAAEDARKEQERIDKLRLDGMKEYGAKSLQLSIENNERIKKIKESQYDSKTEEAYIAQSNERMQRELDIYTKGLDDKVSAFSKYQQTQRDVLKEEYNNDVFGIVTDPELSRPENSEQLKAAIIGAKALNDYKISLYEQSLEQEKSAMYAFQKTERQMLVDEGASRLADAKLQTDELKDYRIEAIEIEEAYKLSVFDINQDLKMLELKKSHMSEMQYIREKYALEQQLINSGNETPETKSLQLDALRDPAKFALKDMLGGLEQESPMGKIQADYEANLLVLEEYEQKYTDLIGVQTEARLAIEKSYQDAKRDLFLTQGEELFSGLSGLAKSFAGEQSGIYRALFAVEKGFAIAQSAIAIQQSIAKAMALGFPQNIPVIGQAIAQGAGIISSIKSISGGGFKTGGYTGNMGVNQVAGAVHGQEYVFDAQATKRIGVDNLNAMRSGRAANDDSKVNVNIINNSSARVIASDDGQTITIEDVRNENKRSWSNLSNPNSFESKQINRNVQAARRR